MKVKACIKFKNNNLKLTYIGRIGKNGVFHFRNKQVRKACLNKLRETFNYDCPGGSLTIPDVNDRNMEIIERDGFITCYNSVIPEKENNKYIVSYIKKG